MVVIEFFRSAKQRSLRTAIGKNTRVSVLAAAHRFRSPFLVTILRESCNMPSTTPTGAYCVRLSEVRCHFRLRAEITGAARADGTAAAVSSPRRRNCADYQARAGCNGPKMEDPVTEIQQR